MEIDYYLSVLWRRKWVIAATVVFALVVASVGNRMAKPAYEATSVLRVAVSALASQNPALYGYDDTLMNTFVEVATSEAMLEELQTRLGVSQLPAIAVEAAPNTELIYITASSADSQLASQTANTLADILVEKGWQAYAGSTVNAGEVLAAQLARSALELETAQKDYAKLVVLTPAPASRLTVAGQLLQEKQRTYETLLREFERLEYQQALEAGIVTKVEPAVSVQTSPRPLDALFFVLAALAALIAGALIAFVFERIDTRLYATREIENTAHAAALARLPRVGRRHLIISNNGSTALAASIRHFAANLQWMANDKSPRKVMVLAGAEPGQGATTTVANLGYALAEEGMRVAVVDLNIHDPKLHTLFEAENTQGAADVLFAGRDVKDVLQGTAVANLSLLPCGPVPDSAAPAFDSTRVEALIKTLKQQFDCVVIDAPDLTRTDAARIAPFADELILIARRSHVRREAVRSAGEFLARFKKKFLGLVVNEAEAQGVPFHARQV